MIPEGTLGAACVALPGAIRHQNKHVAAKINPEIQTNFRIDSLHAPRRRSAQRSSMHRRSKQHTEKPIAPNALLLTTHADLVFPNATEKNGSGVPYKNTQSAPIRCPKRQVPEKSAGFESPNAWRIPLRWDSRFAIAITRPTKSIPQDKYVRQVSLCSRRAATFMSHSAFESLASGAASQTSNPMMQRPERWIASNR